MDPQKRGGLSLACGASARHVVGRSRSKGRAASDASASPVTRVMRQSGRTVAPERLIEADRLGIPVEDSPFEAAAAPVDRQPGEMNQQRAPVPPPTKGRKHKQILEIESFSAQKRREIVEKEREPAGWLSSHARMTSAAGLAEKSSRARSSSVAMHRCARRSNCASPRIMSRTVETWSRVAGAIRSALIGCQRRRSRGPGHGPPRPVATRRVVCLLHEKSARCVFWRVIVCRFATTLDRSV